MRESAGRKNTVRKLRVAAYCRVSTEEEEQQGSFEIQKLYYTEKINSTPEWEVAGIYADDGISGVHTKKRDGFNQMIQDCKKRKIDLILTKSISRFARNTLDSIQYVRMLKQMGIAVVFEKENINTATMNSEILSSDLIQMNLTEHRQKPFEIRHFSEAARFFVAPFSAEKLSRAALCQPQPGGVFTL